MRNIILSIVLCFVSFVFVQAKGNQDAISSVEKQNFGGGDNPVANSTTEVYSKEKFDAAPAGSFFTKGDTVVMKDGSGNEEIIGREISLSSDEYASRNALSDDAHFLEFRNDIDPDNVAFDNDKDNIYSRIDQGKEGYQKFSNAGGRNYIIPWLANNPGKLKPLSVKDINLKGGSLFDSVKFVMPTNGKYIELSCETTGEGEYKISIPGGAGTRNSFEVYALGKMKGNSSYQDAGKLLIANYAPRTQKVIFVPVAINDKDLMALPLINLDSMKKGLDAIYGKLGISFELFEEFDLEHENIAFLLEDGLDLERKGKWDILSDEMEYIKYLYSMERKVEHGAAYIFILNKRHSVDASVVGDMPRGQASGFMFVDENLEFFADARLVAHELGHGLYSLQHTFDYPALENTETDNLMDYNGGDFLAHFQWRLIQNPTLVWSFLQDDEDGWKTVIQYMLQIGNDIVWVIDGAKYEVQRKEMKGVCPDVEAKNRECDCTCIPGNLKPKEYEIYYPKGNEYRCEFFKENKRWLLNTLVQYNLALRNRDDMKIKSVTVDGNIVEIKHVLKHKKKCLVEKLWSDADKSYIEEYKYCKDDILFEPFKFNVRPCYSFVECKVGNETIYLKPDSSGTSETTDQFCNFTSKITTSSDSIYLYPLFLKDNVSKASGIKDSCKLKIEDYPYLLKEIKFNYDSTGSGFMKSFGNSEVMFVKERDLDIPSKFRLKLKEVGTTLLYSRMAEDLDIPSKFKLEKGENTYSVNGMEVKIIKTEAGR